MVIFEAVRKVDAGAMLFSRDRIDDGLAAGFDPAGYVDACRAPLDVDLEIDRRENRIMKGLESRRETWKKVAPGSVS